jgi:NitT/TauT family transport system substrate-binding protein
MTQRILILVLFWLFLSPPHLGAGETRLRLALLPVPEALPVYVAEAQGYFAELGLAVDVLPVASAVERDQLIQAGGADGMINEISSAASFNRERSQVKIVAIARSPIGDSPLFRLLAAPGSGVESVADLAGVAIGVSKNTVIEYITTRLLTAGGLAGKEIVYQSVPVLPERLQLLLSGQLRAVTLPDPLGYSAIRSGAVEIVNDTALSEANATVITFTDEALRNKTTAVRNFLLAWDKAAANLNATPESFRQLLLTNIRVPKNVAEDFPIPPLPRGALPSKQLWDEVMAWMLDKGLLSAPLAYEGSVTAEFQVSDTTGGRTGSAR